MFDSPLIELEGQNELHLNLGEQKGVKAAKDTFVDRSQNGLASGFPMANGTELLQSSCCQGSKMIKSACVWRFNNDTTLGVVKDPRCYIKCILGILLYIGSSVLCKPPNRRRLPLNRSNREMQWLLHFIIIAKIPSQLVMRRFCHGAMPSVCRVSAFGL
ncbi:hypothetical protein BC332_30603 [Capsicum chinense]|nr:hypothetical protein BC332_30603 [Capsicum chinense]